MYTDKETLRKTDKIPVWQVRCLYSVAAFQESVTVHMFESQA